jgi:hypothetical protein
MPKPRARYHKVTLPTPQALREMLAAEAEGRGEGTSKVLAEVLRKHYRGLAEAIQLLFTQLDLRQVGISFRVTALSSQPACPRGVCNRAGVGVGHTPVRA